MTDAISVRLDAAFVLAVVGASAVVWWAGLLVGAGFLIANAVLIDRRSPPKATS